MYGIGIGGLCWVKIKTNHELKGVIWALSLYYVPLWIAIIINSILYYKINRFVNEHIEEANLRAFFKKINYYPLILVLTGLMGTVDNILFFFDSDYMTI